MSKPEVEVSFEERQSPPPPSGTPIRTLQGMVKTVDAEPTGTPRSFFEQFKIFDNALWFYDTVANLWQSASTAVSFVLTVLNTDPDPVFDVSPVDTINFTGALETTDNGGGNVEVHVPGVAVVNNGITVSVDPVRTIKFNGSFTVTDDGDGSVTIGLD